MKKCEKCRVVINTQRNLCPLCQNRLVEYEGEKSSENDDVFPFIPTTYKQFSLFFKILIFISVTGSVIAVLVNLMLPKTGMWAPLVLFAVASVWISLVVIIRKKNNIRKAVLYQVFIVSIISILWDFALGFSGWSIEFVVPICFSVAIIVFAILYKILNAPIREYIFYFFIDGIFGITPIVFYITNIVRVVIPSLICVGISVISISALIIFLGGEMKAELKRRFHV